jgi:hypothetical protein
VSDFLFFLAGSDQRSGRVWASAENLLIPAGSLSVFGQRSNQETSLILLWLPTTSSSSGTLLLHQNTNNPTLLETALATGPKK